MYSLTHPVIFSFFIGIVFCCTRVPKEHGARRYGDNGYRVVINEDQNGYEPGKIYYVFLLGNQSNQEFTHFTINSLAASSADRDSLILTMANPKRAGRFQLFSDVFTKFDETCVNTVIEANDQPKSEVQIMWVGPATGSGCVAISAMVYEGPNSWYSDDGELTKIICEAKPQRLHDECCACDEAKYSFTFEGIWSNETHPKDYPFAIWLTHFSDVIGASHDSNFSFWGENHIATDGFRSMAEFGSVRLLETELRAKGSRLRTLIKAAGLWYPNVNTNTSASFRVDRIHHKLSLVSMFGPSPDWVVGLSGLNLCQQDCSWTDSLDFDLYPWDAGTDNGISYMSPNSETQPRERMFRITTMYPEDPRQPFYNPKSNEMTPLAKLFIRRDKIIPKNCDAEVLQAQVLETSENEEEVVSSRFECRVTEFTSWSACSVTCGKGIRMRTREYINLKFAEQAQCKRQLISKEMCVADLPECELQEDDEQDENLAQSVANVDETGEGVGVCKTTGWAKWSECSVTCGIGISMRTRTFIDHTGRKKCPHVSVVEKEKCMKPECTLTEAEIPDPLCPVTMWSDWSPCSATCGSGISIRTRILLVENEFHKKCSDRMVLYQQKKCSLEQVCTFDVEYAKEICSMDADSGPCRGVYNRFAYNKTTGTCNQFTYGGCRGNKNNFLTLSECHNVCNPNPPSAIVAPEATTTTPEHLTPIDCVVSDWTKWSTCSVTCGAGHAEKYRQILVQPENGGVACPKRLTKRKRCYGSPC